MREVLQKKSNKRVTRYCDVGVSLATHNQTKIEAVVQKSYRFGVSIFVKVLSDRVEHLMDKPKVILETKECQAVARGY